MSLDTLLLAKNIHKPEAVLAECCGHGLHVTKQLCLEKKRSSAYKDNSIDSIISRVHRLWIHGVAETISCMQKVNL